MSDPILALLVNGYRAADEEFAAKVLEEVRAKGL